MARSFSTFLTGIAAGLALAACSPNGASETPQAAPSPLLYEVSSADGQVEAWLFGTIHALPDGVNWRTETLDNAITSADFVVLEIADLNNRAAMASAYAELAGRSNAKPILERVPASQRPQLHQMIARSQFDEADLSKVDTWAAALMLAQLARTGKSENGVDRAMIKTFADRDIREFEGARKQLQIFDNLAEEDQVDLLLAVMGDIDRMDETPEALRQAWLEGDEDALIEATETGIMADPELREALLVKRNRDWLEQLKPILESEEEPMIAVGAGHLVGPDGLPAMLEEQGFTVRRLR